MAISTMFAAMLAIKVVAAVLTFTVYNFTTLSTTKVASIALLSALISKPALPVKFTPKLPTSTKVPSLGGVCLNNFFVLMSMSYKSVVAAPAIELV